MGGGPSSVAVNSQYVFWGNYDNGAIGRANINGGAVNPALIPGAGPSMPSPSVPFVLSAAPSNKITINSIAKKKKKGTAIINAKVPGPGQATLNQTNTPPDVNAVAAGVKQVGLTITQASSFTLAVKPTGKTAKKLDKQIKKQLKKKNKAKAKVNVTVFIHFVPAGVAGVPNTQQVTVTLVSRRPRRKRSSHFESKRVRTTPLARRDRRRTAPAGAVDRGAVGCGAAGARDFVYWTSGAPNSGIARRNSTAPR